MSSQKITTKRTMSRSRKFYPKQLRGLDVSALKRSLAGPTGNASFMQMAMGNQAKGANLSWEEAIEWAQRAYAFSKNPEASTAVELGKRLWPHVQKYGRKVLEYLGLGGSSPAAVIGGMASKMEGKEVKIERKLEAARFASKPFKNLARALSMRGRSHATGCEPLGSIICPATGYKQGDVIAKWAISPMKLPCPKLKRVARSAELYHLSGTFKCSLGAGTDVPGTIAAFIDYDPKDTVGDNSYNINQALAHEGCKTLKVFEDMSVSIRPSNEPQRLYVDAESGQERFTDVGTFYMIALQSIPATTELGVVYFDWVIDLEIPQEDDSNPGGAAYYASASATQGLATNDIAKSLASGVKAGSDLEVQLVTSSNTLKFPPGNYRITVDMSSGSSIMAAGSHIIDATSTDSACAIYTDPALNAFCVRTVSPYEVMQSTFLSCSASWLLSFTPDAALAGSCGVRLWVNAVDFGPYATSFRSFLRLESQFVAAKKQQQLLERMRDAPVMVASASSSSTSSSSSASMSSAASLNEGYYMVRRH